MTFAYISIAVLTVVLAAVHVIHHKSLHSHRKPDKVVRSEERL